MCIIKLALRDCFIMLIYFGLKFALSAFDLGQNANKMEVMGNHT